MYLKLDSNFRPFTYDELIKPMVAYNEAYDAVDKDLTDLAAQAEAFKDVALQSENPDIYNQYSKYSNDLNNAISDLSRGYMIGQSKKNLRNLKVRYASEIEPIKKAKESYDKVAETRMQMQAKNPNIRFKNKLKIDSFYNNEEVDMEHINLEEEYKNAALDFKNAARTFMSDPEHARAVLGDETYWQFKGMGYTPEQMYQALSQTAEGRDILSNIVQSYRSKVEGYDDATRADMDRVLERAILTGLASEEMKENKALDNMYKRAQIAHLNTTKPLSAAETLKQQKLQILQKEGLEKGWYDEDGNIKSEFVDDWNKRVKQLEIESKQSSTDNPINKWPIIENSDGNEWRYRRTETKVKQYGIEKIVTTYEYACNGVVVNRDSVPEKVRRSAGDTKAVDPTNIPLPEAPQGNKNPSDTTTTTNDKSNPGQAKMKP